MRATRASPPHAPPDVEDADDRVGWEDAGDARRLRADAAEVVRDLGTRAGAHAAALVADDDLDVAVMRSTLLPISGHHRNVRSLAASSRSSGLTIAIAAGVNRALRHHRQPGDPQRKRIPGQQGRPPHRGGRP